MEDSFSSLILWGWDQTWNGIFQDEAEAGTVPARVLARYQDIFRVITPYGECNVQPSGRLRMQSASPNEFPVTGDWVHILMNDARDHALIQGILTRRNKFSRKAPGDIIGDVVEEQVLAANLDHLFLINALDHDFNLRRMERLLTLGHQCGVPMTILLSKLDLCPDSTEKIRQMQSVSGTVPVLTYSARDSRGLEQIRRILLPGTTTAFLGASGAGKSTLLNTLAGEDWQEVNAVRIGDSRGRHTTRTREIFRLPQGALILDTPGMRELALWDSEQGIQDTFSDIEDLAQSCRFRDCTHQVEPGCAVMEALSAGSLNAKRYESYIKLKNEMAYTRGRRRGYEEDPKTQKMKQISRFIRRAHKKK